jgi:Gamma tubulin complex component N-terminal/Gamma tubulin complex component C-terminal
MLHELLLVLSAHDSSIFKPWPPPPSQPTTILLDSTFTNIHPSERAALNSLAHLSFLHKDLLSATSHLTHSHASIVIRAILSSVRDTLNTFQRRLEDIERMILTRDDSVVGAYDIVPLARITTLLGEWDRIMGYLHKFVMGVKIESTGAHVLERLHRDIHSGYPDIAALVEKLLVAGEEAWLRQVSSWVLYGRIPQLGQSDFFIHAANDGKISALDENAFVVDWTLWPVHLPRETASSILFIGRALARIQMQSSTYRPSTTHQTLKTHLSHLNSLTFPLHPVDLNKAITAIRLSLSSSVLSTLLPLDTIITLVKRFRQDFLLGHGSLMLTLLTTAEEYLVRRNDRDGGTIKDSEVNALLTKSFAIISRLEASEADEEDPSRQKYEHALKLGLVKAPAKTESVTFDEFLLSGERVQLRYEIQWPLDLFLSRADVETYNRIFLFLLAVKRTQGRLTSLWPGRNVPFVGRGTWSAIHYALFFINSLWNYFQVILWVVGG